MEVTTEVKKMLRSLKGEKSRAELLTELNLKDIKHFRKTYLEPALASGLIEMTIPDKPNSRLQKYCITETGKKLLSKISK
jgi:ATP-dependent DNA helicase RecG